MVPGSMTGFRGVIVPFAAIAAAKPAFLSGGGGAIPEAWDGTAGHYLTST
jgi:hypothetical protein